MRTWRPRVAVVAAALPLLLLAPALVTAAPDDSTPPAAVVIFPERSEWRYWSLGPLPDAAVAGDAWIKQDFDDSAWSVGRGVLGYSASNVEFGTVLRNSPGKKVSTLTTVYFRKSFVLDDEALLAKLQSGSWKLMMRMIADDGAIVYINGVEVHRINCAKCDRLFAYKPKGIVALPHEMQYEKTTVLDAGHVLQRTGNVIAVEVHDGDLAHHDLRMDILMGAVPMPSQPPQSAGEPRDAVQPSPVPCPSMPTSPGVMVSNVIVVRGPYLQQQSASSITVRWRTSRAVRGVVRYALRDSIPAGLSLRSTTDARGFVGNTVLSHRCAGFDQVVTITGLAPDSTYAYRIEWSFTPTNADAGHPGTAQFALSAGTPGVLDVHTFRTAPLRGAAAQLRMWVIGDSGSGDAEQARVRDAYTTLADAEGRPADVILAIGDNAYNSGTEFEYQERFFNVYRREFFDACLFPALGNHDALTSRARNETGPYFTSFSTPSQGESGGVASGTSAYYSVDHGDVHIVVLDSSGSGLKEMSAWLRSDLAYARKTHSGPHGPHSFQWLVAVVHHAPYSKGSEDSDRHIQQNRIRSMFVPMLERAGMDVLISGHSHSYERSVLMRRHHEGNATWDAVTMTVDGGDGSPGGDGAYEKPPGLTPETGFVAVVAGSAGKITADHGLNHPAMLAFAGGLRGVRATGSVLLDVDSARHTLTGRFVDATGAVRDRFQIIKRSRSDRVEREGRDSATSWFYGTAPLVPCDCPSCWSLSPCCAGRDECHLLKGIAAFTAITVTIVLLIASYKRRAWLAKRPCPAARPRAMSAAAAASQRRHDDE